MASIKLFYSKFHRNNPDAQTEKNWGNFGDELSPLILEHLLGRPVEYANPRACDIISIGSLLDKFTLRNPGQLLQYHRWLPKPLTIWGSGTLYPTTKVHRANLNVLALRGPLSQAALTGKNKSTPIAFGDPGIFANELLPEAPTGKKWSLGIIPHYVDSDNPLVENILNAIPHSHQISIMAHPQKVLSEIAACDFILSSSLHGLIAADSLGIPNQWLSLSDNVRGGNFKFRDYCLPLNKPEPTPLNLNATPLSQELLAELSANYVRGDIENSKAALRSALQSLVL